MLTAIAIDDEPVALDVIKALAAKISFIQVQASFTNAFEALAYLQQNKVGLIFLDIKMPDITGIELLKAIPSPPMVIFTTAYSEHAVQSFELDAVDYLLKPFSKARFLKACNKAYELYTLKAKETPVNKASHIFIKSGTEQIRVAMDDILYIESNGNYIQFVLTDKKITTRLTMAETEALLPAAQFIRIHRSYIIAKQHVKKFDKNSVWVKQQELPVGANYSDALGRLTG